jgi:hypothetical protein
MNSAVALPTRQRPAWHALLLGLCLQAAQAAASSAAPAWSTALASRLPPEVHTEQVAERLDMNGIPMHVQVWHAPWSVAELSQWLQAQDRSLQAVQNGGQRMLQRWHQGHFTTISMAPVPGPRGTAYSRAVVATLDWSAGFDSARRGPAQQREWQHRLLPGSKIRQLMRSWDRGQETVWLLADSPLPVAQNWEHLRTQITGMGLQPDLPPSGPAAPAGAGSHFFSAPRQSLLLSLQPQAAGQTLVLIQHSHTEKPP